MILKMLKEAGLPRELAWLPLIESGYKVSALSKARALGLWQFIASTGHRFGLKRNLYIDERMDPIKSTQAAIGYLKELHHLFGDWTTVLAAYNCGEYRVLRVISSQKINYLDNFWDLYEKLPQETARYVPRFLATLHILKNPHQYGLDQIKPEDPFDFETISVTRQVKLKDIAERLEISEEELRSLNPELRYHVLPDDAYELRVPPGKGNLLLAALEDIPLSSKPQDADKSADDRTSDAHQAKNSRIADTHRVKKGETLPAIAKKYRIDVQTLTRANGLKKNSHLRAGQVLDIPRADVAAAATISPAKPAKLAAAPSKQTETTHVVKAGDSVYNIARRYNTTASRIMALNKINNDNLQIGQKIRIPSGSAQAESASPPRTYQVKNGDTPFTIAQNHNMTLEKLLKLNQLSPRSTIRPGQSLMVE
jgi:membrane-bound lytic murein transglycosylase D